MHQNERLDNWSFEEEDFSAGQRSEVLPGTHHCKLISVSKTLMKFGGEGVVNQPGAVWSLKVVDGPSSGGRIWYTTPLQGYFKKKDGSQIRASFKTIQMIKALNPHFDPKFENIREFSFSSLIGKDVEVTVERRAGKDGEPAKYVNVLQVNPWVDFGSVPSFPEKKEEWTPSDISTDLSNDFDNIKL